MLCSVVECGRGATYKAKQLCQKHYFRQWRYGTTDLSVTRSHRIENDAGYQLLWSPQHPLANKNGYVFEHRAVLFKKLNGAVSACEMCGKAITWESCKGDHIDCDVRNNAPNNLRPACNRCNSMRGRTPPVTWTHTHKITFENVTLTPTEWARDPRVNVARNTIVLRKKLGMTDAEALFSPKRTHNGRTRQMRRAEQRVMVRTYRAKARELGKA